MKILVPYHILYDMIDRITRQPRLGHPSILRGKFTSTIRRLCSRPSTSFTLYNLS